MPHEVSIGAVGAQLRAAVESRDRALIGQLLAPDVRWGGEQDTPETCHDRADVLRWYAELDAHGVRARVEELCTHQDTIVAGLRITWPDPAGGEDQVFVRYQVFRVVDGLIADIRGYPDRAGALASTATPGPGPH